MIWMFTCVNLFDKGRRIKGWVPPDALAVAVAAGQHCHQHIMPKASLGQEGANGWNIAALLLWLCVDFDWGRQSPAIAEWGCP